LSEDKLNTIYYAIKQGLPFNLELLDTVADWHRIYILLALAVSEIIFPSKCLPFSGLMKFLGFSGSAGRSKLSYHLRKLRKANLITRKTTEIPENPSSYRIYKLTDKGKKVLQVLGINQEIIEKLATLIKENK